MTFFLEKSINFDRNNTILLNNNGFIVRLRELSEIDKEFLRAEIQEYYFKKTWGLKLLARNVFNISYTNCRTLFKFLDIEFRRGYSVITDNLKDFRSKKALIECKDGTGFANDSIKRFAISTNRGVQGYYFNNSTQEFVWLRSTYEYIYAKFLNKIKANWKSEQSTYNLSDGTKYHPDFYIYNDDWQLKQIIEIKGFFDNRAYKVDLLKEDKLVNDNIDIILIRKIDSYLEEDKTYLKELKEWKLIRKSKEYISNL